MRIFVMIIAGLMAMAAAAAWALTPDEVIQLKKAGVSDATIQKMLEQEQTQNQGPVTTEGNTVVYSAGSGSSQQAAQDEAHERWKEEKSMDMLQGTILDTRQALPVPPVGASEGQQGGVVDYNAGGR